MNKKILISLAALAIGLIVIVQIVSFSTDQSRMTSILGTMILDYNTDGEAKFRDRFLTGCRFYKIDLSPSDIEIVEDKDTNQVIVTVSYDRKLRILFVPVKDRIVVTKKTTNLGM